MNMRRLIALIEGAQPDEHLADALWWVQRWVSGSMDDEDWAEGEASVAIGVEEAFRVVQAVVGNKRSVGKVLWRSLGVPNPRQFKKEMVLRPHTFPFQSFTTSRELAIQIGRDLDRDGKHVIVSANVPPQDVMFGMADLLQSKHPEVGGWLLALEDWYDQQEVLVRVAKPLPLLSVEII